MASYYTALCHVLMEPFGSWDFCHTCAIITNMNEQNLCVKFQNIKTSKACMKPAKKSENKEPTIYEDPVFNVPCVETTSVGTQTASLKCDCACHAAEEEAFAEKEAYRLMVQGQYLVK